MATGIVRWFNALKGHGFIQNDDASADVFVHDDGLSEGLEGLNEGMAVEFDIATDEKTRKKHAVNVRRSSE